MARSKSTGGCGALLYIFVIVGVVSVITDHWKLLAGIAIAVLIAFVIYCAYRQSRDAKSKRDYETQKNIICGEKLTGGYYVAGRDIPAGIYDVRVIEGKGELEFSEGMDLHLKEGESFRNIEIPLLSQLVVPTDMSIDLYNHRDFPKPSMENPVICEQRTFDFNNMDGHNFEYFCAEILRKNGYQDVEVTPGSGDHGVDITALKEGIRYAVQCKRYSDGVGNKAIQEIYSGMNFYHCNVGIVMTNSYFTQSAIEEAKRNGIVLWDGQYLKQMVNS